MSHNNAISHFILKFSTDLDDIILLESKNLTNDEIKSSGILILPFQHFRVLCGLVKYPRLHWKDRLASLTRKYTVFQRMKKTPFPPWSDLSLTYQDMYGASILGLCHTFLKPGTIIEVDQQWMRVTVVRPRVDPRDSILISGNRIGTDANIEIHCYFDGFPDEPLSGRYWLHCILKTEGDARTDIQVGDLKLWPHLLEHEISLLQEETRSRFALRLLERTLDLMEDRNNGENSSLRVLKYRLDRRLLLHQLRPLLVDKNQKINKLLL
jgi:hypothetical protein